MVPQCGTHISQLGDQSTRRLSQWGDHREPSAPIAVTNSTIIQLAEWDDNSISNDYRSEVTRVPDDYNSEVTTENQAPPIRWHNSISTQLVQWGYHSVVRRKRSDEYTGYYVIWPEYQAKCTEYSVWRAWRNHIKWGDNRVSSKVTTYFPSWNSSGGSQML
jgi:hypothetical protein